jgi:hypothetical protein
MYFARHGERDIPAIRRTKYTSANPPSGLINIDHILQLRARIPRHSQTAHP